jgi:hypothetical protein
MFYWTPLSNRMEEWEPVGGWNASFSEQERIQSTNLFFFFKKKYAEKVALTLAIMTIFKQKYHGLQYSEDQESLLLKARLPIRSEEA